MGKLACSVGLIACAALCAQDATEREKALLDRIEQLEKRLAAVEARLGPAPAEIAPAAKPAEPQPAAADRNILDALRDTTLNATLDGYYSYNFDRPGNRSNALRAYDQSSNSFSLSQAVVVIENAPHPDAGKRFGMRLDLQYGQATALLQGNPANELRPAVYRPLFQAYGTYVAPVGSGLTVDFGKWASSLGFENNYAKDQMNYSRSFLFVALPFYHFGFRAAYNITPKLSATYWLVNGAQQSEDFNAFKSQAALLTVKPTAKLTWNLNYYAGREARANAAGEAPRGRLHIVDICASWTATDRLTLAAEADDVISRTEPWSAPQRLSAVAGYAQYRFARKLAAAMRGEYLSDHGYFSGITQALKETTVTLDYRAAEGFVARLEWRRDWSDRPFFQTGATGLKREQNTATLGLIWWFGRKQGPW